MVTITVIDKTTPGSQSRTLVRGMLTVVVTDLGFFTSMNMERSQMQMVRSPQADARLMPLGLKVTVRALSLCFSVKRHVPVDTSHTLTV